MRLGRLRLDQSLAFLEAVGRLLASAGVHDALGRFGINRWVGGVRRIWWVGRIWRRHRTGNRDPGVVTDTARARAVGARVGLADRPAHAYPHQARALQVVGYRQIHRDVAVGGVWSAGAPHEVGALVAAVRVYGAVAACAPQLADIAGEARRGTAGVGEMVVRRPRWRLLVEVSVTPAARLELRRVAVLQVVAPGDLWLAHRPEAVPRFGVQVTCRVVERRAHGQVARAEHAEDHGVDVVAIVGRKAIDVGVVVVVTRTVGKRGGLGNRCR